MEWNHADCLLLSVEAMLLGSREGVEAAQESNLAVMMQALECLAQTDVGQGEGFEWKIDLTVQH
jgi:hypothetical protein